MSALAKKLGHGQRILITGSRDWDDKSTIGLVLAGQARQRPLATLVSGACPTGADRLCEDWWATFGGTVERHPADWSQGRSAGPARNRRMVELGADICLAFIGACTSPRCRINGEHDSHGATGCADLAERAGIETRRFTTAARTTPTDGDAR